MKNADDRLGFQWEKIFAYCGILFGITCGIGLEYYMPQPPAFDISAAETARYYADNQIRILLGMTFCSVSMAFLLAWTIQLGVTLWRLGVETRVASLVATISLAASPIQLAFCIPFFTVAAYRPEINPEIIRIFSDISWISSMLVWPQLMAGMALTGVIIFKTQGRSNSFPKWTGWLSLIAALLEPPQAAIVFTKTGPLAPNGWLTWYGAVFSWGPWIVLLTFAMIGILSRQERELARFRPMNKLDAENAVL